MIAPWIQSLTLQFTGCIKHFQSPLTSLSLSFPICEMGIRMEVST